MTEFCNACGEPAIDPAEPCWTCSWFPLKKQRPMLWTQSWRADPEVIPMADRHYNRQKVGSKQFAPPGRCLVLKRQDAFWITSFPFAQYVKHQWAGAWVCSAFRNEGHRLSSGLIRQAVAATRWYFGNPPPEGVVSFVDPAEVRPKATPGYCFIKAGFEYAGTTKGGLLAFLMPADRVPAEQAPLGAKQTHAWKLMQTHIG